MYNYTVKDRFLKYVTFDTQADPESKTYPSSMNQLELSKHIQGELAALGIKYETNEAGYIYGFIPSNTGNSHEKVCFCAHMDTAPDASGTDVKPRVHHDYQGQVIDYPDDVNLKLDPQKHSYLMKKIGDDIITASGLTLLGSDDKSGIAIIMDMATQIVNNPEIPHGEIRLLFTTDEEVGKGVDKVDLELLDADFGYTLDGAELGKIEYENFSANGATLDIKGVSAHPCCAKGIMQNAIKIASEVISNLPVDTMSPETTEHRQGFIHPTKIEGKMEDVQIQFILRDFDTPKLDEYEQLLRRTTEKVLEKYPNAGYELKIKHQYRNMREVLDNYPQVIKYATDACANLGIEFDLGLIRGGTDGAVLSHKGLPCPNLFTGMQAIHSKYEWVSVQDMQKAVDMTIEICKEIAKNKK
ncbi:MAG TPA: peptidase T [Saprospiraceae bacterium]|nr:peptidase T [Saprospiraceae bacterium]HPQ20497.1 peptidase T [Saprospiraceae bacterium]